MSHSFGGRLLKPSVMLDYRLPDSNDLTLLAATRVLRDERA
jgi:hypothetical protein